LAQGLPLNQILLGDCMEVLKSFPKRSINLVVTSPPYDVRFGAGYKAKNQDVLFLKLYSNFLDGVCNEIFRILRENGQFFINLKSRVIDKTIIPPTWILFLESIKRFKLKSLIIWKYAGSFDSSFLRFRNDYEFIFHFTKSDNIYLNKDGNLSSVWYIPHTMTKEERTEHPTQYPEKLVERILKTCSHKLDIILDPFVGSGTTCVSAHKLGRQFIGIDLNPSYFELAKKRLQKVGAFSKRIEDYTK